MEKAKPVTDTKIMGTDIPDVTKANVANDQERRWMSRVAVTTAVLATLSSLSTMFSSNNLNEAMIEQIKASDGWAFYQAKGIKAAVIEARVDATKLAGQTVPATLSGETDRYKAEQEQISSDAKAHVASSEDHRHRYKILGRASTAFQVGIALSAVAILVRKNWFWAASILLGVAGCVFFAMGMMGG